jgi:hypothetical protein
VNFTDISRQFARTPQILEARFALNALMEIPAQVGLVWETLFGLVTMFQNQFCTSVPQY